MWIWQRRRILHTTCSESFMSVRAKRGGSPVSNEEFKKTNMTESKKENPKTLEEELAEAKSERKFEIGFFLVALTVFTVLVIIRVNGVITLGGMLTSWYSCDDGTAMLIGDGASNGFAGIIIAVVFYLIGPLFFLYLFVMGLFYMPYDAFIKKPKEIRTLEWKINEQNKAVEQTKVPEQTETDGADGEE